MFRYANPAVFMGLSGALLPWVSGAAALALTAGLWLGFHVPPDYQQGMTVTIMFVHVPAAIVAELAYGAIALASLFSLVWRHPLADTAARAAAPLGAVFTALGLITGSLWGRPMWGAYWVWDARLTSFLLLLFLYLGYIALWNAIEDEARAARAAAILALVGAVNLPIIKFSVDWWNTLHQGESIVSGQIASVFLWPLLTMALGYTLLFAALWMVRIRTEIVNRRARNLMQRAG
ncbi:MAG: cytochrome c biogenesis protein CcsA [Alphaproteobacteria bacterium]|jgi:heme exporter protein C|nr:cytochrome c biogenesis protein CcsA [Alphaproteobacteria bacterium]